MNREKAAKLKLGSLVLIEEGTRGQGHVYLGVVKWATPRGGVLATPFNYRRPHTRSPEGWWPFSDVTKVIRPGQDDHDDLVRRMSGLRGQHYTHALTK